jgi:Zn-dependent protease
MQETVIMGFLWYFIFVFALSAHEAAHALAAYLLGDRTAYHGGQVSLNPIPHIQREPFGMVIFPIITYAMNGWMMGWASTPYDPCWAERYPRRAAAMAAAGPAANFILALVAGLLLRYGKYSGFLAQDGSSPLGMLAKGVAMFLLIAFLLNLLLAFFNMLPLPPLDGASVLEAYLTGSARDLYRTWRAHPYAGLIGLVIAWKIFGPIYSPIEDFFVRLLFPGVSY